MIDLGGPDDLWFHLADISSCHVVAIVPKDLGRAGRGKIIRAGARLCKENTAKVARERNVTVTYAAIKAVRKLETPGAVIVLDGRTIVA